MEAQRLMVWYEECRHLLIDSKPRRLALILPPALPLPLVSAILDTLFVRFSPPSVSLLSSPTMVTVAAGLRSALVIDIGWTETIVTAVYEFREVRTDRSVRAGKLLLEELQRILDTALRETVKRSHDERQGEEYGEGSARTRDDSTLSLGFEMAEEVGSRLLWCRPGNANDKDHASGSQSGLPTVQEHDEEEDESEDAASAHQSQAKHPNHVSIPLGRSFHPEPFLTVPFSHFSQPVEEVLFGIPTDERAEPERTQRTRYIDGSFDDHELPLPLLIYNSLLHLPIDARGTCMSRLVLTGGCARILGLRGRLHREVGALIAARGWDPTQGRHAELLRQRIRARRPPGDAPDRGVLEKHRARNRDLVGVYDDETGMEVGADSSPTGQGGYDGFCAAAFEEPEVDDIDRRLAAARLQRERVAVSGEGRRPSADSERSTAQATLRCVETSGAWAGGSLITQLKVATIASVERDSWLATGVAGASKEGDVDVRGVGQQRQSLGAARGVQPSSWTLGSWGIV